jgi:hypothetical protein
MAYRQPLKNVMMGIPRAKMGAQRCARKKQASNAKMAILPRQANAKRCVEMGSTWGSLHVMMGTSLMAMAVQPCAKKRYFGIAMVALPVLQTPVSTQ